jgi:hypothetical protein
MKRIWIFHAVAFLGAFFFFQIQPMTSKLLLPVFGGSYLVWGACMVFYQAMLLAGYIYAHTMQRWLGVARYAKMHWILLLAPLFFMHSRLQIPDEPFHNLPLCLSVFAVLLSQVGLPVFVFSTTSLILQRWLSESRLPERDNPYVLYGASNLGSILGLLTYPFALEPLLKLDAQWDVWRAGYVIVALLQLLCTPFRSVGKADAKEPRQERLEVSAMTGYFLLGLAGPVLLLAATNVITLDIASVPFLWVLPLSVYLLSFVVTFKRTPWYPAWMKRALYLAVIVGIFLHLMTQLRLGVPPPFLILLHLLVLFIICVGCNGELILSKPENPESLTTFYLLVAAGGLAGSILVNWLIPMVSTTFVEYPLALVIAIVAIAQSRKRQSRTNAAPTEAVIKRSGPDVIACLIVSVAAVTVIPMLAGHFPCIGDKYPMLVMLLIAVPMALAMLRMSANPGQFALILAVAAIAMHWTEDLAMGSKTVQRFRNFYGIYHVTDKGDLRYLKHGTTLHGREYTSGPNVGKPLGYYHESTPAAEVMASTNFHFKSIGMIGLGTGALTTYAGAGQNLTMFELDRDNLPIADKNFTYLAEARKKGAKLEFVFGDGRISLRHMPDSSLDLLVVDAFNSDSIPVHLLTVEALHEYFRVLGKDGLLLMHVSNKVLDLVPVVYSGARAAGLYACDCNNAGHVQPDADTTFWMALSQNRNDITVLVHRMGWNSQTMDERNLPRPWTDQYSNLLGAMLRE